MCHFSLPSTCIAKAEDASYKGYHMSKLLDVIWLLKKKNCNFFFVPDFRFEKLKFARFSLEIKIAAKGKKTGERQIVQLKPSQATVFSRNPPNVSTEVGSDDKCADDI